MVEKQIQDTSKLINLINDLNLYLKFLEQRVSKIEIEIKSLNEKINFLSKKIEEIDKKNEEKTKNLNEKVSLIEMEIEKLKVEIKKKANISDLKELKALIEIFNPLKSVFVTKEEVKRIINEIINIKK